MVRRAPDPVKAAARQAKLKAQAAAKAEERERKAQEYRESDWVKTRLAANHQPDYRPVRATCKYCELKVSCLTCLDNGYCEVCGSWTLDNGKSSYPGTIGNMSVSFSNDAHGNVSNVMWT